ncbi:MAG: class I SAM-dependent methyltransferase [Candidatus Brockarchaeota archaeon]|nr:class I SAM-dependent methyltransferase [Candidatus Brockarchaeota archaeon]
MEETIMGERDIIVSRMLSEFPYLSSPIQVVDAALDLAELHSTDVLTDLGCGDGSVLLRAAERYGVFSVGFELDCRLINIARRRVREAGLNHMVNLIQADLFRVDLSRFKVIYVYPFPSIVKGLTIKLLNECLRGTRILVHDHPLEGLEPLKSKSIPSGKQHLHTVYLYVL